jgi:hypothetical protein
VLAQKLATLLLTEDCDCVTQAGELLLSLGEHWRPDFLNANKLYNLKGKVLALEGFILVYDRELCFFLIPLKYKKHVQATSPAFYYFINNSKNKYGNAKISGPRTILSLLTHLNRVI